MVKVDGKLIVNKSEWSPRSVLHAGETAENRADTSLCSHGAHWPVGRLTISKTNVKVQ